MKQYVLVDLDNTVCATWRREDLIQLEGWDAFHADCINDDPILDVVGLINALHKFEVIVLTGRNKKFWPATHAWLNKHNVRVSKVLMRADDDYRPSAIVKVELAIDWFTNEECMKNNVAFIIDDDEKVIQAFAALGITALHCQPRRS